MKSYWGHIERALGISQGIYGEFYLTDKSMIQKTGGHQLIKINWSGARRSHCEKWYQ